VPQALHQQVRPQQRRPVPFGTATQPAASAVASAPGTASTSPPAAAAASALRHCNAARRISGGRCPRHRINKPHFDAQNLKLINSAQGPEPDTINQARLTRSRSLVPCYNKSHFDAQNLKLIDSAQGPEPDITYLVLKHRGTVVAYYGTTANTYIKHRGTVVAYYGTTVNTYIKHRGTVVAYYGTTVNTYIKHRGTVVAYYGTTANTYIKHRGTVVAYYGTTANTYTKHCGTVAAYGTTARTNVNKSHALIVVAATPQQGRKRTQNVESASRSRWLRTFRNCSCFSASRTARTLRKSATEPRSTRPPYVGE
jgi:hypothetical protein